MCLSTQDVSTGAAGKVRRIFRDFFLLCIGVIRAVKSMYFFGYFNGLVFAFVELIKRIILSIIYAIFNKRVFQSYIIRVYTACLFETTNKRIINANISCEVFDYNDRYHP